MSPQLGTTQSPLVPPYGAAALNNEAFAQRPPMPADPVGPAGAPAPPSAHGESQEAAAFLMLYCGLPAPMVSVAAARPPVRVVCRGCGLVRMEVEGAPPPPPSRPPPPPPPQ